MASKEQKVIRRAQAMAELNRLSGLLAQQLSIDVPDVQVTNRDGELAEIQRIENINGLLAKMLEAGKVESEPETEAKKSAKTKTVKQHGPVT